MYEHFINDGYLDLDPEVQEFCQRFLFLEYLDDWEQNRLRGEGIPLGLEHWIYSDMYLHVHHENYETAQLYKDTIDRYKIDLPEFE